MKVEVTRPEPPPPPPTVVTITMTEWQAYTLYRLVSTLDHADANVMVVAGDLQSALVKAGAHNG